MPCQICYLNFPNSVSPFVHLHSLRWAARWRLLAGHVSGQCVLELRRLWSPAASPAFSCRSASLYCVSGNCAGAPRTWNYLHPVCFWRKCSSVSTVSSLTMMLLFCFPNSTSQDWNVDTSSACSAGETTWRLRSSRREWDRYTLVFLKATVRSLCSLLSG